MAKMQEFKCPCCGGSIEFDSSVQKMKCPYCDTEFDVKTLSEYAQSVEEEEPEDMSWSDEAGDEWREIGTKQDYEHEYGNKPLGEFVREIVGLDMNAAKEAFSEYLTSTKLDSRQIYFVNQIVEYIVHNGMLKDLSVLQESPFTDRGSIAEVFSDLNVWVGIRKVIETINANAAA